MSASDFFKDLLNSQAAVFESIKSAHHDCFWFIVMVLVFQTRPYLIRATFGCDHVLTSDLRRMAHPPPLATVGSH